MAMVPPSRPTELKQALVQAGLDVYRTLPDQLLIAERVRDNLIMDSGVALLLAPTLGVQVTLRAQASDHPGEVEARLWERAEALAASWVSEGWQLTGRRATPVTDPSDAARRLDTWYELVLFQAVGSAGEAVALARVACGRSRLTAP